MKELIRSIRKAISESGLSRVHQLFQEHDCALITAFRGSRGRKTNEELNHELKGALLGKGYGVTAMDGAFIEKFGQPEAKIIKGEDSWFVVNLKDDPDFKSNIIKAGRHYDQDSVLLKERGSEEAYYYGTNATGKPGLDKIDQCGIFRGGKSGQFMTAIKGRPFVFEAESDFNFSTRGRFFPRDVKNVFGE